MADIARFRFEGRPWTLNSERRGSTHWSARADATREWREAFYWLGKAQSERFLSAHVIVEIAQRPPLADTGNAYGSIKAAIDGLVDAGVLPGDGPRQILSLTMKAPRPPAGAEQENVIVTLVRGSSSLCLSCQRSR